MVKLYIHFISMIPTSFLFNNSKCLIQTQYLWNGMAWLRAGGDSRIPLVLDPGAMRVNARLNLFAPTCSSMCQGTMSSANAKCISDLRVA